MDWLGCYGFSTNDYFLVAEVYYRGEIFTLIGWFPSTKGLRYGYLISSYLFILVLEIFNDLMKEANSKPGFTFHPSCQQLGITHLSFADDMIILVSGDLRSFLVIKETLQLFGDLTGLRLNC
ncbi:hypothetical protein LIER_41915 [Lithospermum erythrorhizon]|uniref:Reverse transcriptase domain-containing protein n=1 Tax=Lithospermum erythrorhizon TaxID=34254 RepID=A0AAV3RGP3_LITER